MLIMQIIIFILGLFVGYFLNICICRISEKKSVVSLVSHCPKCKHELVAVELVPILGYLINKGKCRYCKDKISLQYPLVELITGIVFVLLFNKFLISVDFLKFASLSSLLIAITVIDLERQEIPDEMIIIGLISGLLFNIYDIKTDMVPGIIGFIFGGGVFLIIAMLTNGAIGGGDIKLISVLGLFFGWKLIILISLIAFVIGAIASIILILAKLKTTKDFIPFGPFIAIAALTTIFYGIEIVQYYMQGILI